MRYNADEQNWDFAWVLIDDVSGYLWVDLTNCCDLLSVGTVVELVNNKLGVRGWIEGEPIPRFNSPALRMNSNGWSVVPISPSKPKNFVERDKLSVHREFECGDCLMFLGLAQFESTVGEPPTSPKAEVVNRYIQIWQPVNRARPFACNIRTKDIRIIREGSGERVVDKDAGPFLDIWDEGRDSRLYRTHVMSFGYQVRCTSKLKK